MFIFYIKISNISPFNADEPLLVAYLRNTKYDIEKAVKKIETYQLMEKSYSEYVRFHPALLDKSLEIIREGCVYPLIERDSMGRRVIVIALGKRDTQVYSGADIFRTCTLITILLQDDEITSLAGVIYIFDFIGIGHQHLPSIRDMQYLVKGANMCIARVKQIVCYNFPYFMSKPVKIMISCLSKKIQERVVIAEKVEQISIQPKSILPENLGGHQKLEDLVRGASELCQTEKSLQTIKFIQLECVNWDKVPRKSWLGFLK